MCRPTWSPRGIWWLSSGEAENHSFCTFYKLESNNHQRRAFLNNKLPCMPCRSSRDISVSIVNSCKFDIKMPFGTSWRYGKLCLKIREGPPGYLFWVELYMVHVFYLSFLIWFGLNWGSREPIILWIYQKWVGFEYSVLDALYIKRHRVVYLLTWHILDFESTKSKLESCATSWSGHLSWPRDLDHANSNKRGVSSNNTTCQIH